MGKKLLIVDDDKNWLFLIKNILLEIGYLEGEIIEAYDGREAREIILAKKCNKVLSDNKMPYYSGLELLFEIRANQDAEIASIPFVILSSFIDCEEAVKIFKATACIDKNMPIKTIKEMLSAYLPCE